MFIIILFDSITHDFVLSIFEFFSIVMHARSSVQLINLNSALKDELIACQSRTLQMLAVGDKTSTILVQQEVMVQARIFLIHAHSNGAAPSSSPLHRPASPPE